MESDASTRKGYMDFAALYHFLFETFEGIGILVLAGVVISVIACAILERRTRRIFTSYDDEAVYFDEEND